MNKILFPLRILVAHNHTGKKVFALPFVIRKNDVELRTFVCGMVGLSRDKTLGAITSWRGVHLQRRGLAALHHPSGCHT